MNNQIEPVAPYIENIALWNGIEAKAFFEKICQEHGVDAEMIRQLACVQRTLDMKQSMTTYEINQRIEDILNTYSS